MKSTTMILRSCVIVWILRLSTVSLSMRRMALQHTRGSLSLSLSFLLFSSESLRYILVFFLVPSLSLSSSSSSSPFHHVNPFLYLLIFLHCGFGWALVLVNTIAQAVAQAVAIADVAIAGLILLVFAIDCEHSIRSQNNAAGKITCQYLKPD